MTSPACPICLSTSIVSKMYSSPVVNHPGIVVWKCPIDTVYHRDNRVASGAALNSKYFRA